MTSIKIEQNIKMEPSVFYIDEKEELLRETLKKLKPEEVHLNILKDIYQLSNYEISIMERVLQKKTNRQIADELYKATKSIENVINESICRKLNVYNKIGIIQFVQFKLGLYF